MAEQTFSDSDYGGDSVVLDLPPQGVKGDTLASHHLTSSILYGGFLSICEIIAFFSLTVCLDLIYITFIFITKIFQGNIYISIESKINNMEVNRAAILQYLLNISTTKLNSKLCKCLKKNYHISGYKNSSRFATGKLVTSIGIKETEKDSVTQEKGTKLFSVKHYQIFITFQFF
ncbi:GPALPP motifs-containing protein 1 [Armadillidium vulgare]|nr:GPALPP motifs-containing protein 1 [Armadillidium vulgare]